jgi:6-phosphogluconolactonase
MTASTDRNADIAWPDRYRWLGLFFVTCILSVAGLGQTAEADHYVWFGCYTGKPPRGEGIYVSRYSDQTGELGPTELACTVKNPSFLTLHPTLPVLYAVSEIADLDGKPTGGITSFVIDPETGKLTQQSVQPSGGKGPCHLSVDRTGSVLLAANYGSGSAICLGLSPDGSLQPVTPPKGDGPGGFLQHNGSGPNKSRQQSPHGHSIDPTPDGRFAISCDLGADQVFVHSLDTEAATLTNHSKSPTQPGAGPRHFAFHPSLPYGYANNELNMTVTAFGFDGKLGQLKPIQTLSTLPESLTDRTGFSTAEIAVHPNGRFLYVSNRGHDSLACFAIDQTSGKLSFQGAEPTRCQTPRHFAVAPGGQRLFAAGQSSSTVTAFTLDPETGKLSFTGKSLKVPSPVCILFSRPLAADASRP